MATVHPEAGALTRGLSNPHPLSRPGWPGAVSGLKDTGAQGPGEVQRGGAEAQLTQGPLPWGQSATFQDKLTPALTPWGGTCRGLVASDALEPSEGQASALVSPPAGISAGAFHLECSTQLRSDCTPLEQGGTTEDVTHPSVLLGPAWRAQCTRTPREPDRRSPCPPHLRLLPSWLHSSTVERGGALGGCPTSPWPPATRRPQQAEARLPQTQHRGTCGERWDGRARLQGAHPTFCEPPREGSEGTIRTGP